MWAAKGNAVSLGLLLFVLVFAIGGNIGVQADSHAEINNEVASITADLSDTETEDGSESIVAQAVAKTVAYGAGPIAHTIHTLSFVPVIVWRSIGVLLVGVVYLNQAYTVKRVIMHG